MKIAYAVCNIGFGHSTRSLNIMNILRKRGHEVEVLVGKPYDKFFTEKGFKTHQISSPIKLYESVGSSLLKTTKFLNKSLPKYLVSAIKIKKILKKVNPNVLVSDSEISSLINSKKIKSVLISHQMNLFSEVVEKNSNKVWHKFIKRYVDVMIVPDILGMKVPEKIKHKVIKVGPLFDKITKSKSKLRRELDIKGKTSILMPSFANTNKSYVISKLAELTKEMEWNFILLGQDKNKKIGNVKLFKKRADLRPCKYLKAGDLSVVSGYSSLMESVYYQKPVFFIPTQTEQRIIGRLGSKNGILKLGSFEKLEYLKRFMNDRKTQKEIIKKQKKYRIDGNKQSVEIIESLYKK